MKTVFLATECLSLLWPDVLGALGLAPTAARHRQARPRCAQAPPAGECVDCSERMLLIGLFPSLATGAGCHRNQSNRSSVQGKTIPSRPPPERPLHHVVTPCRDNTQTMTTASRMRAEISSTQSRSDTCIGPARR